MLVYPRVKVTKKEVLRRRDTGDDGLRSEYLVQKIVIPINVPTPKKGDALSWFIIYTTEEKLETKIDFVIPKSSNILQMSIMSWFLRDK